MDNFILCTRVRCKSQNSHISTENQTKTHRNKDPHTHTHKKVTHTEHTHIYMKRKYPEEST